MNLSRQSIEAQIRAGFGADAPIALQAIRSTVFPADQVQQLLGAMQNGSPLRTLLDKLPDAAGQDVQRALLTGLGVGDNPNVVAKLVKDAFMGNLSRAQAVARDAMLGSYRRTAQGLYRANSGRDRRMAVVSGPRSRDCLSCIAMDGTIHPLSEQFGSHSRCRCAASPVPYRTRLQLQTGEQWFNQQDAATQQRMMGPAAYQAFKAGDVTLTDFVNKTEHPEWGTVRTQASLSSIVGAKASQQYLTDALKAAD